MEWHTMARMAIQGATDGPSVDELIGERVHTIMWRSKIPQKEIGALLGIDQSAVSKKLRGQRAWSADDLVRVARRLNVSVGVLFGEEPPPTGGGLWAPRGSNPQPTDYKCLSRVLEVDFRARQARRAG